MRKAVLLLLLLLAGAMADGDLNVTITFSIADPYYMLHNDTVSVTTTIALGENMNATDNYSFYMSTTDSAFTINGTKGGVNNDQYNEKLNGTSFTTTGYTLKAMDNVTFIVLGMDDDELCAEIYNSTDDWFENCTSLKTPTLVSLQGNAVWDPMETLKIYSVGKTSTSENTTFMNTSYYVTHDAKTCATGNFTRETYEVVNKTELATCPSGKVTIYLNATTPGYQKTKNFDLYMVRNLTINASLYAIELFGYERPYEEVPRIKGNDTMRIKGYVNYDNNKTLGASPGTSDNIVWLKVTDNGFAPISSSVDKTTGYFQFNFEMPTNTSEYTLTVNASGMHDIDATKTWKVKVNNTKQYAPETPGEMGEIRSKISFAVNSTTPLVVSDTITETIEGNVTVNCTTETVCTDCVNETCTNCTEQETCVNVTADPTYLYHTSTVVHINENEATPITLTASNTNLFEIFGTATLNSTNSSLLEITPSIRDSVPEDGGSRDYTFHVKAKKHAKPGTHNGSILFKTFYGDLEESILFIIDEEAWPEHESTIRRYIDYTKEDNMSIYLKGKNTKTIPVTIKITEDIPKELIPTLENYYVNTPVTENNVTTNTTTIHENMTHYYFSEFPHILDYDPRVQWTFELPPGGVAEVWYSVNMSVEASMFSEPDVFVDTHGLEEEPINPPDCNEDGVCDLTETIELCPLECLCGNGICDDDENYNSCSLDCEKEIVVVNQTANQSVIPPDEPEPDYTIFLFAIITLLILSSAAIIGGVIYWKKDKVILDFVKKIAHEMQELSENFPEKLKEIQGKVKGIAKKKPKEVKAQVEEAPKADEPVKEKTNKKDMIETATGFQEADSLDTIGERASDN